MINERSLRVIEVMAIELEAPLVLDGSCSVSGTIEAMRDRRLGYALITDEDKLAGIFSRIQKKILDRRLGLKPPP